MNTAEALPITPRQMANTWSGKECTLDGKPARITGRLNEFATVATIPDGPSVEFSWQTVDRIMTFSRGQFASGMTPDPTPKQPARKPTKRPATAPVDCVTMSDADLSRLHQQLTEEIQRRTPDAEIDFSFIRGQEMCKRAFLVALAGGHSICIVGPHGVGKSMLRSAARQIDPELISFEALPCKCGHYGSAKHDCTCTRKEIETHRAAIPSAEIVIEAPEVPSREMTSILNGTTSADIQQQMDVAAATMHFTRNIHPHAESLLTRAFQDMGIDARQRHAALAIANTIAALAGSNSIDACHIAEAINYRSFRISY